MKFGGSSVASGPAIAQVAGIVQTNAATGPVVVVSALQGVTDALLSWSREAVEEGRTDFAADIGRLSARHKEALNEAAVGMGVSETAGRLDRLFAELDHALRGVGFLRELSPRSQDLIVSFGERLSAPIVAAALRSRGLASSDVDARQVIETDDRFTSAEVRFDPTGEKARRLLLPLVERGVVPVVTGFIAATDGGLTTTIGRGGSDYTAAILGGVLGADEIWIWKEVDGVLSADPGIVPEAALLSRISYDEAAELSYFGAKVLHPKTMIPAIAAGIPIRLRNTFRPEAPGTLIGRETAPTPAAVKAVTAIRKLAMVTIEGKGMAGIAGFAAHVFAVAGRLKVNILMFSQSSSEQNICLVIDSRDGRTLREALTGELREELAARNVDKIVVDDGMAAVAVIGEGMKGTAGVAAKVFAAAAGTGANILAIAQGSSERNISFIVREAEADAVVRALHREFAPTPAINASL